ncbi:MAG: S-ribosylhomocysteine lyase [Acholeplasmatales bacterium]|jgi:S-ribosylhomocysteine lyase|nr:S-ribosylhomocysteine lyase [Acholeplasmatales bacterium]
MTKSFEINHLVLQRGIYLNDIRKINDETNVYIYDWRIYAPSELKYLNQSANHTIEHLLADYFNNSKEVTKIAIFPYGCLTGFGIALAQNISPQKLEKIILDFIQSVFAQDNFVPGNSLSACGNPRTLNYLEAIQVLKEVHNDIINGKYHYVYA